MNLNITFILHSTQQNIIFQHYYQSYCDYLLKVGRMDKEQTVFEQLTLSDFKNRSSTALKNFNSFAIIMTNSSDKKRISRVWYFCICYLFLSLFNRRISLVNFVLYLKIFKILKISFWTFSRKNCISLALWALFFDETI